MPVSLNVPATSGVEDSPPQRALDAATARRDFVEQRDLHSFGVCRKGMLEWYCNDEWIGALSRLDFNPLTGRCRGVLRNSASTRGTWEPGVLPRGSGADVQGLFASLADRAEVMHNFPVQGQRAVPRETEVSTISAPELSSPTAVSERPSGSEGPPSSDSRSTFSRRWLGIMSRVRSSPVSTFSTPPTTPSPRASDLAASIRAPPQYVLNLAKMNGAYMEVHMRSTWMLCKRGRIERIVDGTWREAVTKILPTSAESKKLTLQNTHGETKTLLVPEEGNFLSRLANLAERGGLVHELIPVESSDPIQDQDVVQHVPRNPVDDTYRMRRLLGNSVSFWPLSADAPQPLPEQEREGSSPGGTGSNTTQSTEESITLPGTPELQERPENMCIVCLEAPKNTVLFPCRHLCSCARCSVRLERCPLCRKDIEHRVEVWVSA